MSFKILFMGTPEFSVPILKSIFESNHKVLEVYTQPPKKKNRGQKILNSPIHEYAKKLKISVRNPVSLDQKEEIEHIKNLKPDIVIVVAYGKILPSSLLNLENILFINIHASLLPRWRGAAPIQRAIMNMDCETGVSIMKIEPKLDSGPVMLQSKVKIHPNLNCEELSNEMSKIGSKLILDALELIKENKAKFITQNESEVTYAKKIEKTETKINWDEDAKNIVARINALNPNPGCWFELDGSRVKIIKAKKAISEGKPGTVLDEKFTVGCSKNAVQILEIKKEGKQKMTTKEFLKGNRIKIGKNLK
ncbi:methionyl-tRNA formyltransferase [Candidatus Pelagibacter bacterium]|jgi:methionyl-tRNA formyltransferase|nr:methionyl-tRNA formyltransferase [Candidatus Pelagibacter bacterium]